MIRTKQEAREYRAKLTAVAETLPDNTALVNMAVYPKWETGVVYAIGDRRRYNNSLYKCLQAHTSQATWTPDVAVSLWVGVSTSSAWQAGVAYVVGDKRTYGGNTYSCLQAHTSQTGWEPPNVPALWKKV